MNYYEVTGTSIQSLYIQGVWAFTIFSNKDSWNKFDSVYTFFFLCYSYILCVKIEMDKWKPSEYWKRVTCIMIIPPRIEIPQAMQLVNAL